MTVKATEIGDQVQAFREALRPFGLDRFMASDAPDRIITMADGRMLAEYSTMWLPIWYPEKLKDAAKVEKILRELMDLKEGSDFCHRIVFFGREVCSARNPGCESCPLADLCLKREKENGKG